MVILHGTAFLDSIFITICDARPGKGNPPPLEDWDGDFETMLDELDALYEEAHESAEFFFLSFFSILMLAPDDEKGGGTPTAADQVAFSTSIQEYSTDKCLPVPFEGQVLPTLASERGTKQRFLLQNINTPNPGFNKGVELED